jgi:hypothetical protein
VLIAIGWKNDEALNRHTAKRLREGLKREPTSKEITPLRHGEQVLKLDNPHLTNSTQLKHQARALREASRKLRTMVRAGRKKSRRLRRAAATRRTGFKKP